jgi:cytidylate kinase
MSTDALVERRVKEWLARRQAASKPKAVEPPPGRKVIALTGQYGALGNEIGARVAEKSGFHLYDREIIEMVAQRAHTDPHLVERFEERESTFLRSLVDQFLTVDQAQISNAEYFQRLTEVVGLVGHQGEAVILGRAANIILGPKCALRVRCIAPRELRIDRNMKRLGVSRAQAETATDHENERRIRWVRTTVCKDATDPALYDIMLNTEHLSVDQAADLILAAFRA